MFTDVLTIVNRQYNNTIVLGFPTDINNMLTKGTRKTLLSKPNTFTEI